MQYIRREQFIWDFIQKNKIPFCYKTLLINNEEYNCSNFKNNEDNTTYKVNYISLFPNFFKPTLKNENKYKFIRIKHQNFSSLAILNNDYKTADDYIANRVKASLRSNLRKRLNRLESCFDVKYTMFYGSISKDDYNTLMDQLYDLSIRRFEQKGTSNYFLENFVKLKKEVFSLINKKKASIYVIYNNTKPIGISLNFQVDNMFFGYLTSYDIDYSKFGIGNILIYKQLDWVLKHNYLLFDMGVGVLDYKKAWSNTHYDFEYHIIYKKCDIIGLIIAQKEIIKVYIKNLVKTLKILERIQNFKSYIKRTDQVNNHITQNHSLEIITSTDTFNITNYKEINIKNSEFKLLRQPVYDFLYNNKFHINDIKVFKLKSDENIFILKTENTSTKITLHIGYES